MLVACYSNIGEEALSVGSKLVNADKQTHVPYDNKRKNFLSD